MPAYRIVVLPTAARELAKLPRPVARCIAVAVVKLARRRQVHRGR